MTSLIAEIGWNHMGQDALAREMIHKAAESGAKYAKFQTWSVNRLKNGEWDTDGRREIYNSAELTLQMHHNFIKYCDEAGTKFMSSAFSVEDAQLLNDLGLKIIKIPSFEVANYELLNYCDANFDELIVSTGTATTEEINQLTKVIDIDKTTVMHCVSSYPCGIEKSNLPRLNYLKNLFPNIGYSDHVFGISASIYALEFDLKYIEKHFTTDHDLPGRDNKFAILPEELKQLNEHIKNRQEALTNHGVDFQDIEQGARDEYRGRFNKGF